MKIKDRLVVGVIAGLGANVIKIGIEQAALRMGLTKETGAKKAAGFFVSARKYNTPQGKVVGFLADNTIAGFLGVFAAYLFTFTGKDNYIFKGAAIGNMSWSSFYGIMTQMGATKTKSNDPNSFLASFVSHTAFGITKSVILTRIADPALFKPHFESLGVPENDTMPLTETMKEKKDRKQL